MPTQQDFLDMQDAYRRLSPHPDHFTHFLARLSQSTADTRGWPDEQLAIITAPTLLVLGDRDFTTVEHGAVMQQLIPGSQLAGRYAVDSASLRRSGVPEPDVRDALQRLSAPCAFGASRRAGLLSASVAAPTSMPSGRGSGAPLAGPGVRPG